MALVIRFRKMGRTNRKTFRLVVTDKRNPRDGKYIEMVGWYDPFQENEKSFSVKADRVKYWLDKGAILSEKAESLIKKADATIIKAPKKKKAKAKTAKKATPKKEAKPKETKKAKETKAKTTSKK